MIKAMQTAFKGSDKSYEYNINDDPLNDWGSEI